jgi:ElaA protein
LRALVFIVEQRCVYNDVDGRDAQADHLYLRDAEGGMIAYSRVLHPGVSYPEPSIGRVITHPCVRGTGLGREMTREAIRWTEVKYPGLGNRINAQRRLEKFYESFGFRTVSEPYLVDEIEHVEMLRGTA